MSMSILLSKKCGEFIKSLSLKRMTFKKIAVLGILATGITAGVVISQSAMPPLVVLSPEPLYMNGAKTKANLTLALSVEFPTVGQTYRDTFDQAKTYVGYFDSQGCYGHHPASDNSVTKGDYFEWARVYDPSTGCGGGGFNGNFLNWATSSAIDILRYGLTGGNRTVDTENLTVVDRAWLPDNFYRNGSYFSEKVLPNALVSKMIETSAANKAGTNDLYIYNCRNRLYFAKSRDTSGNCTAPFNVASAGSDQLIGPTASKSFYLVRNVVCDSSSAPNRLMTYDPGTRKWSGLCYRYPSGKHKPVGQFQMNAENLRVSVFGYLQDDDRSRYGGVMRAPLKYLGPRAFDNNFNLLAGVNPRTEWDATTGVFVDNPQSGDATYGDQGHPLSGAINYINKFGTLDPNNIGKYKSLDPVSELYYEALRYIQGKSPTSGATSGTSGNSAATVTLKENFPVYSTWTDPFTSFQEDSTSTKSCLRNSILTIADTFTHSDRSVPGNNDTSNSDYARAVETNPNLDVPFWTSIVGSFESNSGLSYTDGQGNPRVANNISVNSPYYPNLVNAATMEGGATGGSFHLAGMAYWANTHSFRTDLPKARVKTYAIDVNENRRSDVVDFRRQRQLYLAGKYGGFDDSVTSTNNPGNTGNPYATGDNVLWIDSDGDAKNYFLVSDAQKFLDSISDIFARVVEETGSIAGGAISTQRLVSGQSAGVFQARFNPVSNFWSGRVFRYPLSVSATDGSLLIGSTATWEAGDVLTRATKIDYGVGRKIVIGPPIGTQGTQAPTNFLWADLPQAHKNALNTSLSGTTDTLGSERVNYIRGDQRKEITSANPNNLFRPRDIVLGDIVNSSLVYQGKPSNSIAGADYQTFYNSNSARDAVIFVNANDGMLHAFNETNGSEAFAFIPGFLAGNLSKLPDEDYSHISMADSSPAVGEAKVGTNWKSVLVSGVGGGGQGVFALDVTNPSTFSKNNVLWEFTDRDHPAMGNVIGTPRILKVRTSNSSATTPTYAWYAVVASGVNNHAPDGPAGNTSLYATTTGNPSIFLLDLAFTPTAAAGWVEGSNFFRIELPQTSTAIAKGLVGFNVELNFTTGALKTLYAGDMQGNFWKLDFTLNGVNSTNLTTNGLTNLVKFTTISSSKPLFIAKDSTGAIQPITGEPVVTNGFSGSRLVSFGTGKFLETSDLPLPVVPTASFYTLLDQDQLISSRSILQSPTSSIGALTVTFPTFVYGSPTAASPNLKMGWYMDFEAAIGERQISDITTVPGKVLYGSLYPTKGSCGEGGGRIYAQNTLTGNGTAQESEVGILAAPLVIDLGAIAGVPRDTTGKRFGTNKLGIITQGSRTLKTITGPNGSYTTGLLANSWLSWRRLNNYQEIKSKP
jgi:type IV pilus assembly protein PilY1